MINQLTNGIITKELLNQPKFYLFDAATPTDKVYECYFSFILSALYS